MQLTQLCTGEKKHLHKQLRMKTMNQKYGERLTLFMSNAKIVAKYVGRVVSNV